MFKKYADYIRWLDVPSLDLWHSFQGVVFCAMCAVFTATFVVSWLLFLTTEIGFGGLLYGVFFAPSPIYVLHFALFIAWAMRVDP